MLLFQESVQAWLRFQKKKWEFQLHQKSSNAKRVRKEGVSLPRGLGQGEAGRVVRSGPMTTLGSFLRRAHRTLMDVPWQIIQASNTSRIPLFKSFINFLYGGMHSSLTSFICHF